jgi:hypothetical protein
VFLISCISELVKKVKGRAKQNGLRTSQLEQTKFSPSGPDATVMWWVKDDVVGER